MGAPLTDSLIRFVFERAALRGVETDDRAAQRRALEHESNQTVGQRCTHPNYLSLSANV